MDGIDPNVLLIAGGGIALLTALILLFLLRAERSRAELSTRLLTLAESQGQLGQRLAEQERALTDQLDRVTRRVGESLERTNEKTHSTMAALGERLARIDAAQRNIAELSTQVTGLQEVLSNKQARGAFGQFQLNTLVRDALPSSTYGFEVTLGNGRRADCVIKLPNPPGSVVIDSKFPLEGYRALKAARDANAETLARREFTVAITKHINDIAERYIVPGETADSALLFLPSEAVYAELHTSFKELVELSHKRRVYIVSPTTLWAALVTMRAVFKDVHMREHAEVLQREVRAILGDIGRLDDRVGKLQRHFDQAADDMRQIRISTEKVTRRGEAIEALEFEEATGGGNVADLAAERRRVGAE